MKANTDKEPKSEYQKGYNAGYLKGKRELPETRIVLYPWASKARGFWNGDMFEDWLKSDSKDDAETEFKQFLRVRDKAIERQILNRKIKDLL